MRVSSRIGLGTVRFMDPWTFGCDRSELYSDEGTLFGTLGVREWEPDDGQELRAWLLRWN